MEREHQRKKRIAETPPASMDSVASDDTPTRIIRKKRTNLAEQYDEKILQLDTRLHNLEDLFEAANRDIITCCNRLSAIESQLERLEANTRGIQQSVAHANSAQNRGPGAAFPHYIGNSKSRIVQAKKMVDIFDKDPYCARCNEFGHHDC